MRLSPMTVESIVLAVKRCKFLHLIILFLFQQGTETGISNHGTSGGKRAAAVHD
jgi:hypothetical protein